MKRRVFMIFGIVIAFVMLMFLGLYLAMRHPMPATTTGPEAEARGRAMMAAVHADAWERTGAVRWTARRGTDHLWDRTRSYDRVRYGEYEVLLDIAHRSGIARRRGVALAGPDRAAAVDRAWKLWANDSFWLNPVVKLFDDGTTRSITTVDGAPALRVQYASGGVTPGDSYLWILGPDGRPTRWRMWVSILPIPGIEVSWEHWVQLSTGAWVATQHRMGPLPIELTNIAAAETLAALEAGPDPFAPIAR